MTLSDAGSRASTPKRTKSYNDMQKVVPADDDDDDQATEMNNSFTGEDITATLPPFCVVNVHYSSALSGSACIVFSICAEFPEQLFWNILCIHMQVHRG